MMILNGKKDEHLDMLEGGIIQRLLEEKWQTFARVSAVAQPRGNGGGGGPDGPVSRPPALKAPSGATASARPCTHGRRLQLRLNRYHAIYKKHDAAP